MENLNRILKQEDVPQHFVLEGSRLYRKYSTGAVTQLKSMDGNTVVTLFDGHRLRGVDIAWCLLHGNWPAFPIVQLHEDPHDFSEGNLYPARLKRLRYRETQKGLLFYHPLSLLGHISAKRCREHWEHLAHDYYMKDYTYVLRAEAYDREMRLTTLQSLPPKPVPPEHAQYAKRPARPKAVPGMEWHWWQGAWISVPVAVHVSDDYRVRIKAAQAGATSFRFDPEAQRTRAYLPDGSELVHAATSA
jgi:hypothetical protein